MNLDQASLAAQVRDLIRDHPSRHRQSVLLTNPFMVMARTPVAHILPYALTDVPYEPDDDEYPVCGTQGCVAGWAAILTAPEGAFVDECGLYEADGVKSSNVWEAAEKALGLDDDQAGYLFHADRTRDEMLAALDYLCSHPGATGTELAECAGTEPG
jgi:hypothetical protein